MQPTEDVVQINGILSDAINQVCYIFLDVSTQRLYTPEERE
jgi:hypothetical protein